MDNRATFDRYLDAMRSGDAATASALRHDRFVSVWPQSGEVIDRAAADRIAESSPPSGEITGVHGSPRARTTVTYASPLPIGMPVLSVSGGGDTFTFESRLHVADDEDFFLIGIVEFAEGLVVKQTLYWAPAHGPAPWRVDP